MLAKKWSHFLRNIGLTAKGKIKGLDGKQIRNNGIRPLFCQKKIPHAI